MKTASLTAANTVQPGADQLLVIQPLPDRRYALIYSAPESTRVLIQGTLQQVVKAGEMASATLGAAVRAPCLAPRGIKGWYRVDRFAGAWAKGVSSGPMAFANADELYRHLVYGGFHFWGPYFIAHEDGQRTYLFRSHATGDSMLAWEIALHRLENEGQLPDHLEIPDDQCRQCLSHHVAVDAGNLRHCQECHHATDH